MIKFRYLIHKETGTVIKYEDWKETQNKHEKVFVYDKSKTGKWIYRSESVLFSDDFKIIYDSEFSDLELITLYGGCVTRETGLKLKRIIEQNQHLKRKYGIEV